MPLAILFVGAILIAVGVNNRVLDLGELIKEDFRPTENVAGFHVWILALIIAGSIAIIKPLKGIGNGFVLLILLGMLLSNAGFIEKFVTAIEGKENG